MKNFIACNGKVRYDTKKDAKTMINHFRRNKRGNHGAPKDLRCYPCPDCKGWHLSKARPNNT